MNIVISGISVSVTKKKIKNLHLRVKAPDGRVELSVPESFSEKQIKEFLRDKREWILQQQEKFAQQPEQRAKEYVTGELLPVWGRNCRLEVTCGTRNHLILDGDTARLTVKENSTREQRERWINEWYREQLKEKIRKRLPEWERQTGLHPSEWQIKNMKTRWGTCNIKTRKIWLNLQLAKYPEVCLDYVILHELTHLIERGHNQRFYTHVEKYMPRWKDVRKRLNGQIR